MALRSDDLAGTHVVSGGGLFRNDGGEGALEQKVELIKRTPTDSLSKTSPALGRFSILYSTAIPLKWYILSIPNWTFYRTVPKLTSRSSAPQVRRASASRLLVFGTVQPNE
jgi:hypothetical protein